MAANTQQITPFLWFDGRVDEAVQFYTSVFRDSEIIDSHYLPGEVPGAGRKLLTATIRLNGVEFMLLDAGPGQKFSPAISFFVKCETQEEVDHYWDRLSEGGSAGRCGWLTDKYGVSWQIVPNALGRLMADPDREKARRVMGAMMQMTKIEIAGLADAYDR